MIRQCVPIPQKTYSTTKRLQTPQRKSNNIFQAFCLLQIVPEQQIQSRPEDKRRRKEYYSLGKKKRHTAVKNQIVVNKNGYIIHKLGHKKGRRHDYYI